MKKYFTKRNVILIACMSIAVALAFLFAFIPTPIDRPALYFCKPENQFIFLRLLNDATLFTSYSCLHVGYFCGFVLSCTAFVVCLTWLLVNVYKQYRQEHPRKPTYKQRIAELEKQLAELKRNTKD